MATEAEKEINDIRLEVGLLKKDVHIVTEICTKLDVTIDKLQELASTMTKMISMHDQKLEYHQKKDEEIEDFVNKSRAHFIGEVKELHSRITTVTRELTDKVDESEKVLMAEIKALRECVMQINEKSKQPVSFTARIRDLEKWQWMAIGAVAFMAWLVSHLNFGALGNLFK